MKMMAGDVSDTYTDLHTQTPKTLKTPRLCRWHTCSAALQGRRG